MSAVVQFGPFRFRTMNDLDQIRAAMIAREPSAGVQLVGSSVSGQSFQWSIGGATYTEEELGDQLAAAYCSLGNYEYGRPSPDRSASRFC